MSVTGRPAAPSSPIISTLSGSFTATNFTKSGPGNLLISGTNNAMAPVAANLRTMQINEGTVQFAGQSSLPSSSIFTVSGAPITSSQIIISPMDTGKLDLAGLSLTIAGLGGNAAASAATGNVINSGALATLTVAPQQGTTSIFNGLISGNVALNFQGIGQLTLGYNNTYSGGTTIGAGNITSGTGLFTPVGTLVMNDANSLGSGPVTLAGGILNVTEPLAGPEMISNLIQTLLGPGNGYNVTVAGTNSLGSANTTSQIGINVGATNWQGINNLTMTGSTLTITGAANGLAVNGITALSQTTTFNLSGTAGLYLGGQITGGQSITKIGGQTLFVVNTAPGAGANNASGWNIMAGTVEVRLSQGDISNPLTNGTTIQLDGGQLNTRHDGDNLTDMQVLSTFATNNLLIGSSVAVNDAAYTSSANSTLNTDRLSGGSNKTIQFNQLRFGGPLGAAFLSYAAGNGQSVEFLGGLQMLGRDAALSLGADQFTIDGTITGNGTLFRQGAGELDINTNTTGNTATGGTIIASNGDTYFAGFQGTVRTLNATAKLGVGNISVQPDARLLFTAATNLNAGQLVEARSNLTGYSVIGIADNSPVSAYNLRAAFAGGQFVNSLISAPNTGAGILGINSVYTNAIDLARIGDGTWFLGSTQNGEGQNGTYVGGAGKSLTAGAAYNGTGNTNATYRLGAGTQTLYIGLYSGDAASAPNQLTGNANLVVGSPLTRNGGTIFRTTGTAILNTDQNYTGATIVNNGSTLEFRGTMATSGYDVFGTLTAGGAGGIFGNTPVTIRPGGTVRLDNQFDLTPLNAGTATSRWGAGRAMTLDSGTLFVAGSVAADVVENIGTLTVKGGSFVTSQFVHQGRTTTVAIAGFTRGVNQIAVPGGSAIAGNNGILAIQANSAGQLGNSERVTLGTAPTITNGMVAPWMWAPNDSQFLTYGEFGFTDAGFNVLSNNAASTSATASATDRLQIATTATTLTGTLDVYALRPDVNITGGNIIVESGAILSNANATITSTISFNPTNSFGFGKEAIILTQANTLALTGVITADSITKAGAGALTMNVELPAFTGNIALDAGSLRIQSTVGAGLTSNAGGNGSTIIINGFNSTLTFAAGTPAPTSPTTLSSIRATPW